MRCDYCMKLDFEFIVWLCVQRITDGNNNNQIVDLQVDKILKEVKLYMSMNTAEYYAENMMNF